MTQGPIPFRAETLDQARCRLKQYLVQETGFDIYEFESRTLGGFPAIYAEFGERGPEGLTMYVQAWVLVGRNRVNAISVSVPRRTWNQAPTLYRGIIQSFRYGLPSSASLAR